MDMQMITRSARSPEFRERLAALLMDICAVDTTPVANVEALAAAEARVFARIERELGLAGLAGARTLRKPIDPAIAGHPYYSKPYYTSDGAGGAPLDVAGAYAGRCNLLFQADGERPDLPGLALNAHIDVVRPYLPPRREGATVCGRGSCDDKGPLVAIVGALSLVSDWLQDGGGSLGRNLTAMFVIDEEMGGNGSLSLALDDDVNRRYDTLLVLECTSGVIHPANRGAVWYKVEGRLPGANLFEASAYIYAEVEREGRAIKAESRHPLFAHRPVQTCHGILGGFGEHPSRINGRVAFDVVVDPAVPDRLEKARDLVADVLESGLAEYIGVYGDKTKVTDPQTGRPKVATHYDLERTSTGYSVVVHGSTGHMGSILLNDGAITKMASMARAAMASRAALERRCGGTVSLALQDWNDQARLVMEGGQGFLPTHELPEVQRRLADAVMRGAGSYLRMAGRAERPEAFLSVTYDKLHNAAFAGDPDAEAALDAVEAAQQASIWDGAPLRGWDVSCDSRIFAHERPDATVLTGGPGHLVHAHSDGEQMDLDELARFAEFLAYFIIKRSQAEPAAG
jgi:acetylornithine deacetylase/succinyl-diaminopimelate desuccinylase-like protein